MSTYTDMTPRYAPSSVLVIGNNGARTLPVEQYIVHSPFNHPAGCPIVEDCTVLELRTADGSRWYGCDSAYINSELRMIVVGTNSRDEIRMKWEVCRETDS